MGGEDLDEGDSSAMCFDLEVGETAAAADADAAADRHWPTTFEDLWRINHKLHDRLDSFKDGITQHYRSKKWDRFKKYCNPHELIFTSTPEHTSISFVSPISRSFFKLWEVMHDHGAHFFVAQPGPLRAVFLAEGPGGFVEAWVRKRAGHCDSLFGMTLLSPNKSVPDWRFNDKSARLTIMTGADGTGDLYSVQNIDSLVSQVGANSANVITADGGFDFSGNYNYQERLSLRLIAAEVYASLRLQAPGGTLFLKVYDLRLHSTLGLLSILVDAYNGVRIIKPKSSRPANSEKYLLCTAFRRVPSSATLDDLRRFVRSGGQTPPGFALNDMQPRVSTMQRLIEANRQLTQRQIRHIDKTLALIRAYDGATSDEERQKLLTSLSRGQIAASYAWCCRYGTGISESAEKTYGLLSQRCR